MKLNKELIRKSFDVFVITLTYQELCHAYAIGFINQYVMEYIDMYKDTNEFGILLEDRFHGTWRIVSRYKSEINDEWVEVQSIKFNNLYE